MTIRHHRGDRLTEITCNSCRGALWPITLEEGLATEEDIAWALKSERWKATESGHACPECQAKKT